MRFLVATLRRLSWIGCLLLAGCSSSAVSTDSGGAAARDQVVEELFVSAVGLLDDLDQYDPQSVLPQILGRFNQWLAAKQAPAGFRLDPLVEKLPEALRKSPLLTAPERMVLDREDGLALQEAVWLREAAEVAVGREIDDLARARLLFDWTVRNISLEPATGTASEKASPRRPWETLLFGRGQPLDRAWVFILLCRQQGLDAVLLAKENANSQAGATGDIWLVGLLIDKNLYVFDPVYGLPVPAKNGSGIATLEQVATSPEVFEHLAIDAKHEYRYKSEDFEKVVALVEASPLALGARARVIEADLSGADRLTLAVDASALAERLKACTHVMGVCVWSLPLERAEQKLKPDADARQASILALAPFLEPTTRLWQARVLHLMGKFTGEPGLAGERSAVRAYEHCRPSLEDLSEAREAKKLSDADEHLLLLAKRDATYWLGMIALERGRYEIARDYFSRSLQAGSNNPWTDPSHAMLARAYAGLGQIEQARLAYAQTTGPEHAGDLLRARALAPEPAQKAPAQPSRP